ncbi:IS5 family transposase [Halorubrum kocurii]|uniref:Transposase IS4 family protein n=1 Tax=Halorubrum kocurii JCM 14978 TaxID=1230456 RepID=M0NK33_9EURY|nr:transposase IS4 family protein [Halorubrum kocurii JCM 14978]
MAVLDVHFSMKQPPDNQIGWQVLTRNLEQLNTVVANKRYDWDALRHELGDDSVRPVIIDREIYPLDKAHTARHDEDTYHHRPHVEESVTAKSAMIVKCPNSAAWLMRNKI